MTGSDCIQYLISKQSVEKKTGKLLSVTLLKGTMENLDDQHYTIALQHEIKVQQSCGGIDYTQLQGRYPLPL